MLRRLLLPLLILGLSLPAAGCSEPTDHFARALAIERELKRQAPDAGYEHQRYVTVLKELRQVPPGHKDRAKAESLSRRIQDGRRVAAGKKYPQIETLPPRLRGADEPPAAEPTAVATADGEAPALDVVLYSTSWCGYCRKARNWLTTNGVPFVEKDIEKDRAAHAEYTRIGRGYSGVPLLSVNGAVIRGFDVRAVKREIDKVRNGAS